MIKEVIPMKFKKILCCFIFLQFLLFAAHSFAMDTDLYVGVQSTIEPNVLIIFDNSGSMGDIPGEIAYCEYDPSFNYPIPASQPTLTDSTLGKVYKKSGSNWFPLSKYKDTVASVPCVAAQTKLTTYGQGLYTGKPDNTACNSPSKSYSYATGRYLRFLYADNEDKQACAKSKIQIAQEVIVNFLNTITDVRLGLMTFNNNTEGGYIVNTIKGLDEKYNGTAGNNKTHRENLIADVNALYPDSWTPLAETMYEAGLYFQGAASYFNSGTTHTSPVQYYCQKNYIILMTDGMSTQDRNDILSTQVGDRNADQKEPPCDDDSKPCFSGWDEGSDYLDDVAKKHYDEDFHSIQGKQNIVTYTIGFELDLSGGDDAAKAKNLLQRAATQSHGKFYTTAGTGALADAFADILNEVLAKTSSFVAPIVPVSKMEKTTAGNNIYLAFFRPNQSGMWSGNIKKYGVQQTNAGSLVAGDITDSTGTKAIDSNGDFFPSSKSFWTTSSADGGEVEVGGVGEVLQNRTSARNIYTILSKTGTDLDQATSHSDYDLTNPKNAFTTANTTYLTKEKLGLSDDNARNPLINFVRGIDAYDDNNNGETDDKRDWMLGSFLHSRPCIINYKTQTVIYAGANDGMLHAFDDVTGQELWGFIPPCLLSRLKELHTETPGIFVDGSPKAYVTYDSNGNVTKAILIFGLRRGGNYYYGLDVTTPAAPKYAYRIYEGRKGTFNDLGQTWSTPVIAKVPYGSQTTNPPGYKWVAIFGAGYNEQMDLANPNMGGVTQSGGRGMYMADVLTGDYFWGRSGAGGQDPAEADMDYPVPSDVAAIDLDGDGRIDRIYVGDTNGKMWRYNIGDLNKDGYTDPADYTPSCEWTVKKIFNCNPGSSEKRRIFYPPDVTFEKDSTGEYEMLFFGTGDREDPKGTKDIDKFYAFKDKATSTTKGESDLTDVTNFYSLTADQQTAKLNAIKSSLGWYITMDKHSGEKCLANPVVYSKTAYFTSFSPSTEAIEDPCFIGEGTASIYAMNYATGEAAFNYDLTNDTGGTVVKGKSDRTAIIGSAIPSGVVITVIGGKVTAYVGVGGGVYKPTLSSTRSLFPVTWKLVF
jgi:type IV pilus assembly protein PilY1